MNRYLEHNHVKALIDCTKLADRELSMIVTLSVIRNASSPEPLVLNAINFNDLVVEGDDPYSYDGELLKIWLKLDVGQYKKVVVKYTLRSPPCGLLFFGKEGCVTDFESSSARYVFPVLDVPSVRSTFEIHLKSRASLQRLSTGRMVGEVFSESDHVATTVWKQEYPIPAYLCCFAVGNFVRADDESPNASMPIAYWGVSDRVTADSLRLTFSRTPNIMEYLQDQFGPLTCAKYYQLVAPVPGAMENESLVTFSPAFLVESDVDALEMGWDTERVVVHEMAHSYFGNRLVLQDFSHLWLKESFATFLPQMYAYHARGQHAGDFLYLVDFDRYRKVERQSSRAAYCRNFVHPDDLYTMHSYSGASLRLCHLMEELTPAVFWEATKAFVKTYYGKTVETDFFRLALERHSFRSLETFFEQWFKSPGWPVLALRCIKAQHSASITLEQVNAQPFVFNLSVLVVGRSVSGETVRLNEVAEFGPGVKTVSLRFEVATLEEIHLDYDNKRVPFDLQVESSRVPLYTLKNTILSPSSTMMNKLRMMEILLSEYQLSLKELLALYYGQVDNWSARAALLVALGNFPQKSNVSKFFAEVIARESNLQIRAWAVRCGTMCQGPEMREVLLKSFESFGRRTKEAAIHAIGLHKNPNDVDFFKNALAKFENAYIALGRQPANFDLIQKYVQDFLAAGQTLPSSLITAMSLYGEKSAPVFRQVCTEAVNANNFPPSLVDALLRLGLRDHLVGLYPKFVSESTYLLEVQPFLKSSKDSAASASKANVPSATKKAVFDSNNLTSMALLFSLGLAFGWIVSQQRSN